MIGRNILIILTIFLLSCIQKNKEQESELSLQKNNSPETELSIQKITNNDVKNKMDAKMEYDIFLNQLESILAGEQNYTSEEEYFRRLLFQVELNSSEQVTPQLLLNVFEKSLTSSEATKFNEDWNNLEEPELFPDFDSMSAQENFDFTKNTIRFFVADLRRLGDKVLKDPYRGYGITSSSGCRWFNYDIISVFNGWYSFYNDSVEINAENNSELVYLWSDISDILLFGKGYE